MAYHRSYDTGLAPDVAFQLALGVLEASEDLVAHRRPITPTPSPASCAPDRPGVRPTVPQIQDALAQGLLARPASPATSPASVATRRASAPHEAEQQRLSEIVPDLHAAETDARYTTA